MRIWLKMEDVLSVVLFTPKKTPSYQKLVGFHLSITMGYVDSDPYFCIATNTVADLANEAISKNDFVVENPLKKAKNFIAAHDAGATKYQAGAIWEQIPANQCSSATENVDAYLENFISVVQGGPKERRRKVRNLFQQIDKMF